MDFKEENLKIACNELYVTKTCFDNSFSDGEPASHICQVSVDGAILGHCFKLEDNESDKDNNHFGVSPKLFK